MSTGKKICICIDVSGSTTGVKTYWTTVRSILDTYSNQSNVYYLAWNSVTTPISKKQAYYLVNNMRGARLTKPSTLIPHLQDCTHMILITDGKIDEDEIIECERMLKTSFDVVDVYFLGKESNMNLSVASPFIRGTEYSLIINGNMISSGNSKQDSGFKKYYDKPDLFINEFGSLYSNLVIKNVGKLNLAVRNEILDLQKNLMSSIRYKDDGKLQGYLMKKDTKSAISLIKEILDMESDMPQTIAKLIQQLLQTCDLRGNYSFSLLTPQRLLRANEMEDVDLTDVHSDTSIGGTFECPIICDSDVPCLLLRYGTPVFHDLSKKELDAIINAPLSTLNNEVLIERIRSRLDHVVGLTMAHEIFNTMLCNSPYSRERIVGAFVFGSNEDCRRASDFSLANLFFGNKLVGNTALWAYVLYKVVLISGHLQDNEQLLKEFNAYLTYKFQNSKTHMTLTGLPLAPNAMTTVDVAVWYCVSSPFILKKTTGEKNRLRALANISDSLIDILKVLDYKYPEKAPLMASMFKAFAWMMECELKRKQWREIVISHYQATIQLEDGVIIPIDGPSTRKIPLPVEAVGPVQLTSEQIYYLSTLVDADKPEMSIDINLEAAQKQKLPQFKTNFGLLKEELFDNLIAISPHTCRPFTVDQVNKCYWRTMANLLLPPEKKRISLFHRFIQYVTRMNRFPSQTEFIYFVYQREKYSARLPRDTLPEQIVAMVENTYKCYRAVFGENFCDITLEEFIKRSKDSVRTTDRCLKDGSDIQLIPVKGKK